MTRLSLDGERPKQRFHSTQRCIWRLIRGQPGLVAAAGAVDRDSTLLGTIQNVDPRLVDAAQALGAPAWKAHLTITLPLCMRGLLAAFLFAFTFSISAFVIPMILGKGRVLFISNLIYNRFSEIADYPSGAAISIVLFAVALTIVYVMSRQVLKRWK